MNDAKPDPLISASELLEALDDPSIRIADVRYFLGEPERGRLEYDEGHIPGAVFVDIDKDLAAPNSRLELLRAASRYGSERQGAGAEPMPDPVVFGKRMGELGFGSEHTIVIHDAANGQFGARMWAMLDRLGHPNVCMLDGGIAAWRKAGGPWTTEVSTPEHATMTLATEWPGTIDRKRLAEMQGQVDLIDVRAPSTYSGADAAAGTVGGHIPGARNCPCDSMVTEDGRMKSPKELLPLIRGEGERAKLPLVVSCDGGVNACFAALVARVAGLADPLIYSGSFSDWSGAGMPIAQGSEPERPIVNR